MDDLISRQAAIDALEKLCDRICEYSKMQRHTMCGACNLGSAFDVIDELHTAEPEIIRCKDCKHYQFADNRAFGMPVKMCEWFGFEDVDDDDFCSRAERRTDG